MGPGAARVFPHAERSVSSAGFRQRSDDVKQMRFDGGFLVIGARHRASVKLHWSLPLGALVLGRFKLVPMFWLAFLVILVVHELGHAFLVWRSRQRVTEVVLHGIGGECRWDGHVGPRRESIIAWGGVLAQAVLLAGTLVVLALTEAPLPGTPAYQLKEAFVWGNLMLMGLNLLPIPPLDGSRAWRLLRLRAGRRARRAPGSAERSPDEISEGDQLEVLIAVDEQLREITERANEKIAEQRRRTLDP